MKVIILAGGHGTRLSEYTKLVPKPMVKVGKVPIIVHIMKHYLKYGFNDFIIATGYKSEVFKKYFKGYKKIGEPFFSKIKNNNCRINILDTGLKTLTGGRLKRASKYLNKKDENFMFTYGDGVSNVNLNELLRFHKKHRKKITVTAVRPPARFGELKLNKNLVQSFKEKPQTEAGWINGGFFVAKQDFINFIDNDRTILERDPLEKASKKKRVICF